PAGGADFAICSRMFFTSVVWSGWLPWLTSDSTCSCSACWSADRPRSRTETTVGTVARSCCSPASQVVSAVLRVPWFTAATTCTGTRLVAPNGAASCAACSLGALAGRKALLLPWVTLFSEGKKCGTAKAAISQAAMTTQRNLTANAPIPPKMAWMRTRTAYCAPSGGRPPQTPPLLGGPIPPDPPWIWFRTMPLISVVIPVHGVQDYLDRCLDSVLGESASSLEVIAVDDASPDGCGAILAARHDPRLRVISTPAAVGPGPARDLGAKEATGEYVWFVDGDDELAEGALAAVAGALTRLHPDLLIIDFENLYPDGTTSPSGGARYLSGHQAGPLADHPALVHLTLTAWSTVFRRDFLGGLGISFGSSGPAPHEDVPVSTMALLT